MNRIRMHIAEPVFGMQLGKRTLITHSDAKCAGEFCCIHNPSDHHMVTWPMNWRADRRIMERFCEHGIGHPDPDDQAFLISAGRTGEGIHGCDGCCREDKSDAAVTTDN